MLESIKKAALDAMQASGQMAVFFGTIQQMNPIEVLVDQRFTIDQDFLVFTETTKELLYGDAIIRRKLDTGDILVLIRFQGGQKFLVLDRVREV